ncbi:fibronectin type III domain-containing protein [Solicola sp. PLA-1-18]|uniref:fibronectin type III domain-containing protein n=1 Tax=Solicola sp. PLA-1-18 TaxID=3380532 RepID=UPI003B81B86A
MFDRGRPMRALRRGVDVFVAPAQIGRFMSLLAPARKAAVVVLAAAGLTAGLLGSAASGATAATGTPSVSVGAVAGGVLYRSGDSAWFVDPRTPKQRRNELRVPKRPGSYEGRLRETRAVYRTHAGRLAVPANYAFGHHLSRGQALTLDRAGLFEMNTADLSRSAKKQLKRTAKTLTNATSIRCEGYANYGSSTARARHLSKVRAARVCKALAASNPGLATTVVGYGSRHPAVVGGTAAQRELNRRVVVQMTGTKPAPPTTPTTPTIKAPDAPTLTHVTAIKSAVFYAVTAPSGDGGSAVTGYEVSTGGTWSAVSTPDADTLPHIKSTLCGGECAQGLIFGQLRDVTGGTPISLQVRAVNKAGASQPSNKTTVTVSTAPSAPTDLAAEGNDGVITTTFRAPARTGGSSITGYQISYNGGLSWSDVATPGEAPWTITSTGWTNGTDIDVAVRALNTTGAGKSAVTKIRVATVPQAPALDEPALDATTAVLSFLAPSFDGGTTVTSYEISFDKGQSWDSFPYTSSGTDAYTAELSDLTLGTEYHAAIRALNDRGHSASSNEIVFTPAVAPDAPTELATAVQGNAVTLTFTAPDFDGGTPVTGYEVKVDDVDWAPLKLDQGTNEPISATLANQPDGAHTYQVRAINNRGASAPSGATSATITSPTPDAPTINAYGYNGSSQEWVVLYSAGASNGEATTGYEVSIEGGPWIAASRYTGSDQAYFSCPGMQCGWNYGSSVRLRAVTANGHSEPSTAYASDPI